MPKDNVNHPKHYNSHPSGVECIQIARHMNFNIGNAMKYLWRSDHKNDLPIEDLEKAAWYINDEIRRIMHERMLVKFKGVGLSKRKPKKRVRRR